MGTLAGRVTANETAISGLQSSKSDTGHKHAAGDITSGQLALARIPTGTSSSTVARGDHNHDSAYANKSTYEGHVATKATTASTGHVQVGSFLSVNSAGTVSVATGTSAATVARGDHNHDSVYAKTGVTNTLTTNLNTLSGSVGTLAGRVTANESAISELEGDVSSLSATVSLHTTSISTLTSKVSAIETMINEEDADAVIDNIKDVINFFSGTTEDVSGAKELIETVAAHETAIGSKVSKAGDTMSGQLNVPTLSATTISGATIRGGSVSANTISGASRIIGANVNATTITGGTICGTTVFEGGTKLADKYSPVHEHPYAPSSHTGSVATTAATGHVKISNGDVATVAHADGLVAGMDHSHSNYSTTGHTHDDRYYTETEADGRFVNVTGDTMTGCLSIESSAWNNQLTLKRNNNGSNWGPAITFYDENGGRGCLTMGDDKLYICDVGGTTSKRKEVSTTDHKHNLSQITAGTITLSGDVTGTITMNGTNAITATTTVANDSHSHSNYAPTGHASTSTTYGLGTSASTYGHVKLKVGDVSGVTAYVNGEAAASYHNHDGKYVKKAGDTMTGILTISGAGYSKTNSGGTGIYYANGIKVDGASLITVDLDGDGWWTGSNAKGTVIVGNTTNKTLLRGTEIKTTNNLVVSGSISENGETLSSKYVTKQELVDNEYAITTAINDLNNRVTNSIETNSSNISICSATYIQNSSSSSILYLKPANGNWWDYSNVNGLLSYDITVSLGSNGIVELRYIPDSLTDGVEHYVTFTSRIARNTWQMFYVSNTNNLNVKVKYLVPNTTLISSFNSGATAPSSFTSSTKVDTYEYMAKGTNATGSDSYSRVYMPLIMYGPSSSSYFSGSVSTIKFMFKFTKGGFAYSSGGTTYMSSDLLEIIQIL